MRPEEKVILVDASSVFFRAYYAIPYMTAKKNSKNPIHTNAVYGYLTTSLKILSDFKPRCIVHCFDRPEKSHRVKYYKDYKANRAEMPEDLQEQMPYIKQAADCLGIKRMELKGYEADDLIGSLAFWLKKNKLKTVIVSSDKDFAQLISDEVHLFDPAKEILYTPSEVKKKWGIKPVQMVDYLALVGDASDNIPGVRGIGPKSAVQLLEKYPEGLDEIYRHIEDLNPKTAEKLKASKKEAFLSKKLARIVTDLDLVSSRKDIEKQNLREEPLRELLEELEFASIQKKLFGGKKNQIKSAGGGVFGSGPQGRNAKGAVLQMPPRGRENIWTLAELSEKLKPYESTAVFVFENEVHLLVKKLLIKIKTKDFLKLGKILSYKKIKWQGYDLKTIWKKLSAESPIAEKDLMIEEHLISSAPAKGFPKLVQTILGEDFNEEQSAFYFTQLKSIFQKQIEEMNLSFVYENIELKLTPVLYRMEQRGVLIDTKKLLCEKKSLEGGLIELEDKIFALAGHPFNISSPSQLAHVLFEEMELKKGRKTKTGYSTDSDVLHALSAEHPIARLILEYRELFKLKTTYAEGLLNTVSSETKRVHTHFKQTLTATGRLSSVNPNLQNIPIRTERGRQIRQSFISPAGCVLIGADYSQIELRILAHFSKDPGLNRAFEKGEDIHSAAASELFEVPLEEVTGEQRRTAKTVNFGVTYGQGAFSLSQSLGTTRAKAGEIIDRYFTRFKNVKTYIESSLEDARQKGYTETLFGRRRKAEELKSPNMNIRKFGERMVMNSPIQGTASELVKLAMIQLDESLWSRQLLQVHDELLFECEKEDQDEEIHKIKSIMEGAGSLRTPLKIHIAAGKNWNDAVK